MRPLERVTRALLSQQALHEVHAVWVVCCLEAREGPAALTNGHIAAAVGLTRGHVRRCLRLLGRLGLVLAQRQHANTGFDLILVNRQLTPAITATLAAIDTITFDFTSCTLLQAGAEIDHLPALLAAAAAAGWPAPEAGRADPGARPACTGARPGCYWLDAAPTCKNEQSPAGPPLEPTLDKPQPKGYARARFVNIELDTVNNVVNKEQHSSNKKDINTLPGGIPAATKAAAGPPQLDVLLQEIARLQKDVAKKQRRIDRLEGVKAVQTYASDVSATIDRILAHWKLRTNATRVTDRMRTTVHARLEEGYTEGDMVKIADWVATSAWHNRAENPHHRFYNTVALLYGPETIVRYLEYVRAGSTARRNPALLPRAPGTPSDQRSF